MSGALTRIERSDLALHERTISAGLDTFHAVGRALAAIRDNRLYRNGYESFEHYISERWAFSRSQAYRLIDAARVVEDVSPAGGAGPANEAQARELAPLEPAQRLAVWTEATADGEEPTAARLRELAGRALASLSPDEQREVIEGAEARVMAGAEPRQVGGEDRAARIEQAVRLLMRAWKLIDGLGDEADEALRGLNATVAAVKSLPA